MPDQLLPQPPPDAPAPPPGEEAVRSRGKMKWLIAVGVGSMLLLAVGWASPHIFSRKRTDCDATEAMVNAYCVGVALSEFNLQHGRYPDSTTAAEVKRKTGSLLTLGDRTSNDLFAQLMVSGITGSEQIFYAKAKSAIKPDDVCNTDTTMLAHGECVFAYICGLNPNAIPSTPIAFGPVIPGTTTLDGKSNKGKVSVVRLDRSVSNLPINSAGKIIYYGLELLDPRQPFWNGKSPDVKWPK